MWRRAIALTILSMLGLWHPGHPLAAVPRPTPLTHTHNEGAR